MGTSKKSLSTSFVSLPATTTACCPGAHVCLNHSISSTTLTWWSTILIGMRKKSLSTSFVSLPATTTCFFILETFGSTSFSSSSFSPFPPLFPFSFSPTFPFPLSIPPPSPPSSSPLPSPANHPSRYSFRH
ncbi:unnamed protein product [Closterium sp. NIES-53]